MSEDAVRHQDSWQPPALGRVARANTDEPTAATHDPEQVRREAYDAGFAEGLAAGRAQGESIAAEMASLLAAMAAPFRDSEAVMMRELLALVERAVRAVIDRETASGDPDLEKALSEALKVLGTVQEPVYLGLNPADAALCRELGLVDSDDVIIEEEPRIQRGGLTLRAGSAIVDATVEARLEEIFADLRLRAGVPEPTRPQGGEDVDPGN